MREAKMMIATGNKGVGKSYTTLWKEIIPFARGIYTGKPRPVLIFDLNDELRLTKDRESNIFPKTIEDKKLTNGKSINIRAIALKDIAQLSNDKTGMIRRFAPYYTKNVIGKKGEIISRKGDAMLPSDLKIALIEILRIFRNGMLVIEDLRALFGNAIPTDVSGAITRNRHKNLDVIWHLQSVGRILPEYWENVNVVRFHKEFNTIENARDKLPDVNLFMIAEYMVNSASGMGNNRYYIYVDCEYNKLIGNYTKESMLNAIDAYIRNNPKMLKSYMNQRDENNKAVFNYATALSKLKAEMYKTYSFSKPKYLKKIKDGKPKS